MGHPALAELSQPVSQDQRQTSPAKPCQLQNQGQINHCCFHPLSFGSGLLHNNIKGVKFIFTRGHISLSVAFKGPHVILGLYKCNYSLTRGKELGTAAR